MVFHYLPRFSIHDLQRMVEFRLVYGEVSKSMCRLSRCNCCVLLTSLANNGMLTEKEDVTGQKVLTPIMTLDGDNFRCFPTKYCRCWRLWVGTTKAGLWKVVSPLQPRSSKKGHPVTRGSMAFTGFNGFSFCFFIVFFCFWWVFLPLGMTPVAGENGWGRAESSSRYELVKSLRRRHFGAMESPWGPSGIPTEFQDPGSTWCKFELLIVTATNIFRIWEPDLLENWFAKNV